MLLPSGRKPDFAVLDEAQDCCLAASLLFLALTGPLTVTLVIFDEAQRLFGFAAAEPARTTRFINSCLPCSSRPLTFRVCFDHSARSRS